MGENRVFALWIKFLNLISAMDANSEDTLNPLNCIFLNWLASVASEVYLKEPVLGKLKVCKFYNVSVFTKGCFLGWESVRMLRAFRKDASSSSIAKKELGCSMPGDRASHYIKAKYLPCVCQFHFPSAQGAQHPYRKLPASFSIKGCLLLWHVKYFWWLLPQAWLPGLISFPRSLKVLWKGQKHRTPHSIFF